MPASKTDEYIDFTVKEEYIHGNHGASNCPVALAIAEATGMFNLVGWHNANIYWGDKKKVTRNYEKAVAVGYTLDKETAKKVEAYDKGYGMKPFSGRIIRD